MNIVPHVQIVVHAQFCMCISSSIILHYSYSMLCHLLFTILNYNALYCTISMKWDSFLCIFHFRFWWMSVKLYQIKVYCFALYCTELSFIVLYCTALYIRYCIIVYCTILNFIASNKMIYFVIKYLFQILMNVSQTLT